MAFMKNEAEVNNALIMYADMVRRICFMHLKNRSDVEDVFQDVFLKYALHKAPFINDAHEKAWFARVAINSCKDILKSFWKRKVYSLNDTDITNLTIADEQEYVIDAVLRLKPQKYRDVIYLYYYEGYKASEIASIMGQKENTVYTWINRAKVQLKSSLGGEPDEK